MIGRVAIGTFLVLLVAGLALEQRGRFGDQFDGRLGQPLITADNIPYGGRFAFVRLTYETMPGGFWYRGQPAWSHGYPTAEENLMQIFTIASLDIFPQAYNAGRPIFRGLFENNDPTKRIQMFINYNTDISQFWEWSGRGLRPIEQSNDAFKLGVNAIIYGLTH